MREQKFLFCRHCGNLVGVINDSGVKIKCCGEDMIELVANTVDAAYEKHVPVVSEKDGVLTVRVGSVDHPMASEHYIQWIYLLTDKGGRRTVLNPGETPEAKFILGEEKPLAVYEYCNLHGLWKAEL